MEPRQTIRSGVTASALAHLSMLMLVILFSDVHPFGSVTAEAIAVDIVTAQEVAEQKPEPLPEPKAPPSDTFDLASKAAPSAAAAPPVPPQPATPPQAAKPQQAATPQQAPAAPRVNQQQAARWPQTPSTSPPPAYTPPELDPSIQYQMMVGLLPDVPLSYPHAKGGDAFDSAASKAADIAPEIVAEFRRHLKTCAKLPGTIAASDKVRIMLRVFMTTEGRLATEPLLIEASASAKGPLLMRGAVSALQACQPYAMLPADRYDEWKVLDLNFTPQDLAGG